MIVWAVTIVKSSESTLTVAATVNDSYTRVNLLYTVVGVKADSVSGKLDPQAEFFCIYVWLNKIYVAAFQLSRKTVIKVLFS